MWKHKKIRDNIRAAILIICGGSGKYPTEIEEVGVIDNKTREEKYHE
jgi:hypothetical protein